MSSTFRGIDRFLWPAGFCFSVLVAFGMEWIGPAGRQRGDRESRRARWLLTGLVAGGIAYSWLAGWSLRTWEWGLAVTLAVSLASIVAFPRQSQAGLSIAMLVLLGANLVVLARLPQHGLLEDASAELTRNAAAFDAIRERLSLDDRIVSTGENHDFSVMRKSPSVFGVPGIGDYEPLTSRRYAEYYVKMMYGAANELWMVNVNQFYYLTSAVPRNQSLLNLVAARFLAVDLRDPGVAANSTRFTLLHQFDSTSLYENPTSLPRAFFVPSAQVVSEPRDILRQLSSRTFAVRSMALLSESPDDGFLGVAGSTGSARIDSDQSELLTVSASSTGGGFVFVSDQFYPGWTVTVNGNPATILNANYAFRLVRIPPGESTVVFRYEPASLRAGAMISLTTLVALIAVMLMAATRRSRNAVR